MSVPPTFIAEPERNGLQEHDLVPYEGLADWHCNSLLVLAPHPDDEVLGCGGLIARALRRRISVQVIVLSDGGQGGDPVVREAESRAAAAALGGPGLGSVDLAFWHLPDRALVADEALIERMVQAIGAARADWVVAPSTFEVHPDHRAVCRAATVASGRVVGQRPGLRLALCEIGQPLLANTLIDISTVWQVKQRAMGCFVSQLERHDIGAQNLGLNRHRSYTLGETATHAEAFWLVPPGDLALGPQGVLEGVVRAMRQRL